MLRQLERQIEKLTETCERLIERVNAMALNNQTLLQAIQDLSKAVNEHEANIQSEIDAAVKAHDSEDQAAFDEATANIKSLTSDIVGHTSAIAQKITNETAGVDTSAVPPGGNALGTSQPASNTGIQSDVSTANQNAGAQAGVVGAPDDPAANAPTTAPNKSNQQ